MKYKKTRTSSFINNLSTHLAVEVDCKVSYNLEQFIYEDLVAENKQSLGDDLRGAIRELGIMTV